MTTDKTTSLMPRRKKLLIGVFLVMIIVLLYLSITIKMEEPQLSQESRTKLKDERFRQNPQENKDHCNGSAIQKDLEFLHSAITKLRQNGSASIDTILKKIEGMIDSLQPPLERESEQIYNESKSPPVEQSLLDVCPEKYMGTRYGYMYFVTGWVTENCTNVKPIENVVSIVINPTIKNDSQCPENLERVVNGIRAAYKKVNIFVPDYSVTSCSTQLNETILKIKIDRRWKPGRKWNALVKSVSTPYVFIAKDLDYFVGWLTRLERQIRIVSTVPSVKIAGGSVRNITGHWQVGCYQSEMRNYVLTYKDGYYASKNECMYCDYLTGPFVADTKLFEKVKFHTGLDKSVLFEDFFINVRKLSHLVMNCPDVMHLASDATITYKENKKSAWISLVREWELNRVVLPNNRVFGFGCEESGIHCKSLSSRTNSFLIPPCCIEQYAKAIDVFHEFCVKNNLFYEFDAGSALGLVKMSDYIPWDLDGDATFYTKNYTIFYNSIPHFNSYGIHVSQFEYKNPSKTRAYFTYSTPDLYVEFWGEMSMSKDLYETEIFRDNPTKAKLHDLWVYASISPGLLARNRYGVEILKHAHSWLQLGMKTSWETYSSGHFKPCKKPHHHACLDHFLTDGNLQFKIPNPT